MTLAKALATRADSWINAITGMGGTRDKTTYGAFGCVRRLSDQECANMFAGEDLSARICDLYPREAMRESFELGGVNPDDEHKVRQFLEGWDVNGTMVRGLIWGRVFGGSAAWCAAANAADNAKPYREGEPIGFVRVLDKRHLTPTGTDLDAYGRPTVYNLHKPEGTDHIIGQVHASRLVVFPGVLTDDQARAANNYWDYSALQRPFAALRSEGTIWNAAEQLITEASIGVIKIKNLHAMVAAKQKDRLIDRLQTLALGRSIAKHMTLDADKEDYSRVNTTFAGVADLTDRSIKRIAMASEIPVTVLMGEAPAGLNATGDSDLRWFLMRVHAYQVSIVQARLLKLVTMLLRQPGAPTVDFEKLCVIWPDLWTPSAKERADLYLATANGDAVYIDRQVVTPEEIALSRFGSDGYSQETQISRELREPDPDGLPELTAGVPAAVGAAPAPGSDAGAPATEDVQKTALNGAQVASLVDVVKAVVAEEIPRDAAVEIVALAYQVTTAEANRLLGSAGKGFVGKAPEPAPVFGAPRPPPETEPEEPAAPPVPKKKKTPPPAEE
jgi:hypothetical protein